MKYFKHLAVILVIVLSALSVTQMAHAAAKTRANLQTDLLNGKETNYNVHTDFANKTTINDSTFNLTTDTLDDIPDGSTNSLIPAADATLLGAITSSAAELNLNDGAVAGNTVASKTAQLDASKRLQTDANVGTAGTGVTAVELGDGMNHVTILTLTAAALTPTIPADAEGAGVILYTFPAGVYILTACHMDVTAFTADSATNAVDMGMGSLISSGDIATLTTAAMEDCVTGQTVADISSPATEKSTIMTAGAPLLFEAGGSHVVHLNVAGTWNNTVATADVTGTVTLYWTFLGS